MEIFLIICVIIVVLAWSGLASTLLIIMLQDEKKELKENKNGN